VIGTPDRRRGRIALALNIDVVAAVPRAAPQHEIPFAGGVLHHRAAVRPSSGDVISIALVSLLLSLFATLYPSWRAARVNPARRLQL